MSIKPSAGLSLFWLPIFGFFLYSVYYVYPFTLDDSFIFFRYAENTLNGSPFMWNKGEAPPTEGFTSFLWVVILSVSYIIKTDILTFSKITGILCYLATAGLVFIRLNKERSALIASLAAATVLLNPHGILNAVSGMETALATFLLTAFAYAATYHKQSLFLGVLAFLCGIARPEFNLPCILVFAWLLYKDKIWGNAVIYIALGAVYFAWRFHYYGFPFPLPFYIKQAGGVLNGLPVIIDFIKLFIPCFFGLAIIRIFLKTKEKSVWDASTVPTLICSFSLLLYFIIPQHIMGGNFRYVSSTFPLLVLLLTRFTHRTSEVFIAVSLLLATLWYQAIDYHIPKSIAYLQGLEKSHIPLGKALSGTQGTLLIGDAGAVPFYSKWRTIDTLGLNNRDKVLQKDRYDYAALLDKEKPELIILLSQRKDRFIVSSDPLMRYEQTLYDEAMKRNYIHFCSLEFNPNYNLFLLKPQNLDSTFDTLCSGTLTAPPVAFSR